MPTDHKITGKMVATRKFDLLDQSNVLEGFEPAELWRMLMDM